MSFELHDLSKSRGSKGNSTQAQHDYQTTQNFEENLKSRHDRLNSFSEEEMRLPFFEDHFNSLTNMFPTIDEKILKTILKGNNGDLSSSIDAALALNISLSSEKGFAVINNNTSTSRPLPKAAVIHSHPLSNSMNTAPSSKPIKPNQSLFHQDVSNFHRGRRTSLPKDFLCAPSYRLVVDSINDAYTNFTVTFLRKNKKLGVTVQETSQEIIVRAVHGNVIETKGQGLAERAGVRPGDVLIGLNSSYFSPGLPVADVMQALAESPDPVVLHFLRRHFNDDADLNDSSTSMSRSTKEIPLHRCAALLLEQGLVGPDRAKAVSLTIQRLKGRTLQWDSGWIGQNYDNSRHDDRSSPASSQHLHQRSHSVHESPSRHSNGTAANYNRPLSVSFSSSVPSPPQPYSSVKPPMSPGHESQTSSSIYADMVIQTKSLRPALATRILRAEYVTDHTCFVIWVLDVKTGAEWIVRRRFREFYDFRERICSIRPSIAQIDFPGKSLALPSDAASSLALADSRLRILEMFLKHISNLVSVYSLHPTTSRVQQVLQRFLGVEERMDGLIALKSTTTISTRQSVQVFIHSILNLAPLDKLITNYVDQFRERWAEPIITEENRGSVLEECLRSLKEFIDNLQGVLIEGLGEDCMEVAKTVFTADRDGRDGGGLNGDLGRVSQSTGFLNYNGAIEDGSQDMKIKEMKEKKFEEQLKKIVRSAVRRQLEILVFMPCNSTVRTILHNCLEDQENSLQRHLEILARQPQSFFGIPTRLQSPTNWTEAVTSFQAIPRKSLPQDRVEALLEVASLIPKIFSREQAEKVKRSREQAISGKDAPPQSLGADDFLPIFIFVVVQARIQGLLALKEQLQHFCDPEMRISEAGYYTATLEASVYHILEMNEMEGSATASARNSNILGDIGSDGEEDNKSYDWDPTSTFSHNHSQRASNDSRKPPKANDFDENSIVSVL